MVFHFECKKTCEIVMKGHEGPCFFFSNIRFLNSMRPQENELPLVLFLALAGMGGFLSSSGANVMAWSEFQRRNGTVDWLQHHDMIFRSKCCFLKDHCMDRSYLPMIIGNPNDLRLRVDAFCWG